MKTKCLRCLKRYPSDENNKYCERCKEDFGLDGTQILTIQERENKINSQIQSLINKYKVELSFLKSERSNLESQIKNVDIKIEVYNKTMKDLESDLR